MLICAALLFGNSSRAAVQAFCSDHITNGTSVVKEANNHSTNNSSARMGRRHVKPVNRRVKALNVDLDTAHTDDILFTLQIAHTEKVKTYILSTCFFSHKCGNFKLRGPPQLA
jgi:hypothetical protein